MQPILGSHLLALQVSLKIQPILELHSMRARNQPFGLNAPIKNATLPWVAPPGPPKSPTGWLNNATCTAPSASPKPHSCDSNGLLKKLAHHSPVPIGGPNLRTGRLTYATQSWVAPPADPETRPPKIQSILGLHLLWGRSLRQVGLKMQPIFCLYLLRTRNIVQISFKMPATFGFGVQRTHFHNT